MVVVIIIIRSHSALNLHFNAPRMAWMYSCEFNSRDMRMIIMAFALTNIFMNPPTPTGDLIGTRDENVVFRNGSDFREHPHRSIHPASYTTTGSNNSLCSPASQSSNSAEAHQCLSKHGMMWWCMGAFYYSWKLIKAMIIKLLFLLHRQIHWFLFYIYSIAYSLFLPAGCTLSLFTEIYGRQLLANASCMLLVWWWSSSSYSGGFVSF